MDEQIELLIDGVPCALDSVPPELREHVDKSLAAARAAAEKAGAGKAKLRINIKRSGAAAPPRAGGTGPFLEEATTSRAGVLLAVFALLVLLAACLALVSRLPR